MAAIGRKRTFAASCGNAQAASANAKPPSWRSISPQLALAECLIVVESGPSAVGPPQGNWTPIGRPRCISLLHRRTQRFPAVLLSIHTL